jgi:hypothetical protein
MEPVSIVAGIVGLIKAIPILDKWFTLVAVYFVNKSIDNMHKDLLDSLRKALLEKDQRDLEKAIGNPNAGEPSGLPGTVIVDAPPAGVPKP